MTPYSLIFSFLKSKLQVSTVGTNSKGETVDICALEIHGVNLVVNKSVEIEANTGNICKSSHLAIYLNRYNIY